MVVGEVVGFLLIGDEGGEAFDEEVEMVGAGLGVSGEAIYVPGIERFEDFAHGRGDVGAAAQGITLARPDRVTVRCDVHKWMNAYVVVAKNPYYVVSGAGGKFRLEGVPAGHYHLKVWQESLGELDQEIIVEAAKPTETSFSYRAGGV